MAMAVRVFSRPGADTCNSNRVNASMAGVLVKQRVSGGPEVKDDDFVDKDRIVKLRKTPYPEPMLCL